MGSQPIAAAPPGAQQMIPIPAGFPDLEDPS